MTPTIDKLISSDLAALGTDAAHDVPALHGHGIYRDGHAGAQARRDALAEERRVQLALMPLAIAQVFAHRVGRAAAGAIGIVCAVALIVVLADPLMMRVVTWFVPSLGLNLGTFMMVAVMAMLATYLIATSIGEAWFTRRMREAVTTKSDVYADLDKLTQHPIEVAQRLVRRIDGWTVGLALGGFVALATVFGYLMVIAGSFEPPIALLSRTSMFAERAAASNLGPLIYALVLALGLAFVVGRGCTRENRFGEPTPTVARLAHWTALVAGVVLGFAVLISATRMIMQLRYQLPSTGHRYLLAIGAEAALLLVVAWGILWCRRREQKRLGDELLL